MRDVVKRGNGAVQAFPRGQTLITHHGVDGIQGTLMYTLPEEMTE